MARVALVYDPRMAGYRFGRDHPMVPERYTLAVSLMRAWGLLGAEARDGVAVEIAPAPATEADLLRVHSRAFVDAVKRASLPADEPRFGIGPGDTPAFSRMHEISALIAGGTIRALDAVLEGELSRAFSPAGGLHHAHRDRAAGFCVYNDCAVAISRVTARRPGMRVAYVDIDAHHGDGVEECFRERDDVLTISLHESGRYLYPGTGASRDIGGGAGVGFAVNVPLPPHAGRTEYELAFDRVVEPALTAFGPDVVVAQLGADAHRSDPLTHLGMTVAGHARLVARLVDIAEELCAGRLVATGGGGYEAFSATPRMWACAMAVLRGMEAPASVPPAWLDESAAAARRLGRTAPRMTETYGEVQAEEPVLSAEETHRLAAHAIAQTVANSPLLGGGA